MSNPVLFETAEHTAVITLNSQERRNAFNQELLAELYNALDEVRSNHAVRVAILTGAGKSFCSGIAKGYWEDPGNTEKAFKKGWLHTGDLARTDDDGYLWLMDRKKDMIIRGGENIYSVEIENVLYAFPKTLEAAVVGVPDKIFGEQVKAFVMLKQGQTASVEEVRAYCEERLADYKVPKYIRFLEEPLPRNPGGKIKKELLRVMD